MRKIVYKSRFALPAPEADFVCALAHVLNCSPDDALRVIIRHWAEEDPVFSRKIWQRAKDDGRGPWPP